VAKQCFTIAFAIVFMRDVLGIAANKTRVLFKNEISHASAGPVSLEWPLGAMVAHATGALPNALDLELPIKQSLQTWPRPYWDTHSRLRNRGRSEMSVGRDTGKESLLPQAWRARIMP
jgi:hypothetical protein